MTTLTRLVSLLAPPLAIVGICLAVAPALSEQPDRRYEYADSTQALADEREVSRIAEIQAETDRICNVQHGPNSAAVFVDGAAYCAVGRELKKLEK